MGLVDLLRGVVPGAAPQFLRGVAKKHGWLVSKSSPSQPSNSIWSFTILRSGPLRSKTIFLPHWPGTSGSKSLAEEIKLNKLTGVTPSHMETSRSITFETLYPGRQLPEFVRLKIAGKPWGG